MIQTGSSGGNVYANNDTIAVSNTAQLCAAGAETTTFAAVDKFTEEAGNIRWIMVTHASGAVWVAKDATTAAATAGGDLNDRIYVPSGCVGLVIPWSGLNVYFVNAVAGETPSLYVVGWH